MKNKHSWTRTEYEKACHLIRMFPLQEVPPYPWNITPQIWQAADYSYQGAAYEVNGWTNDERCKRFHAIKWRVMSHWYGLSS